MTVLWYVVLVVLVGACGLCIGWERGSARNKELVEKGRKIGYRVGYEKGKAEGAAEERERMRASPYARDWPQQGPLEVMTVQCETVTLRADYIASQDQLYKDPVLKDHVLAEMSKVLYAQVKEFIDVKIEDDPLLYGVRFAGRLIVVKRKDGVKTEGDKE